MKRKLYGGWDLDGLHEDMFFREERPVAQGYTTPLPYPHYTDHYWNTARLIWGREVKTAECNYSDRLWQWDSQMAERASYVCKLASLPNNTARWVEVYLTFYHDRPVILRYIMAGCNLSSGYAYYVYGYDWGE